jgi:MerR family transcriptional regulator, thiopeptide resistance regulator
MQSAKQDWVGLVQEGCGTPVPGRRYPIRRPAVVQKCDEIGAMFHPSDQTQTAARNIWQHNSAELSADLPWSATELTDLMQYLNRARYTSPAAGFT